jgi:hypothetical protein
MFGEAVDAAKRLGYEVRQDWLGGDGGGHCLVRGRKWLLLDLAQTADEQLEVVGDALRGEIGAVQMIQSPALAARLHLRSAA